MSGNEIIKLLHAMAFECLEHYFALAGVSRIDQHGLSGRRNDQDGIAIDRTDIKNVNL